MVALFVNGTPQVLFALEKDFQHGRAYDFQQWLIGNWSQSIYLSIIYIFVIFGIQWRMRKRQGMGIRLPLALWSFVLAIFSILGAVRTLPSLAHVLHDKGWAHSVCDTDFYWHPVTALWSALFTASKVYELGDTIFIVLRKQPLIFLHWYHHVTVFIYSWYNHSFLNSGGLWYMVMNFTVHALMYTYYTLRALRYKPPKFVSMIITTLQIIQMIIGLSIQVWVYYAKQTGMSCNITYPSLVTGFLMYTSYFCLFCHFFYNAYLRKLVTAPLKNKANGNSSFTNGKVNGSASNSKVVSNGIAPETNGFANGHVHKD